MKLNKRSLTICFYESLLELIRRISRECGFFPSNLQSLICEEGPVEAAKKIVGKNTPSETFIKLFCLNRLDLTLESYVLNFRELFSEELILISENRLADCGYFAPQPEA